MTPPMQRPRRNPGAAVAGWNTCGGFSLLELLAVLLMVAILFTALTPAIHSLTKSTGLGIASQTISDEINLCRAIAVGQNKPVEICFLLDPNSQTPRIEKLRSRTLEQNGKCRWISQPRKLPEGISISTSSVLSNLIGTQSPSRNEDGNDEICLRFNPSGEMDRSDASAVLTESTRFITLAAKVDLDRSPDALPKNFATIQIHPQNSQATIYRP